MASKNKVRAIVRGKGNSGIVVGGTMGGGSAVDSENDVDVTLGGQNNRIQVIGGDAVGSTLGELAELLIASVDKRSDKEYIGEIIQQLNEQAAKAEEERSEPKIRGLLNNLATYVGLAGSALTQAEKIRALYEQVLRFFS